MSEGSDPSSPRWGRLPEQVRGELHRREWEDRTRLVARLVGDRDESVVVSLRPPSGDALVGDLAHFQRFQRAWRADAAHAAGHVEWQQRHYRQVGVQDVPVRLRLPRTSDLIAFLGAEAVARASAWQACLEPLLAVDERLYSPLVRNLAQLERLDVESARLLARTVSQLRQGMGGGHYLRALPVEGVDTKFVEQHGTLLQALVDALHAGAATAAGGLLAWLGCAPAPDGWLSVRPLCEAARAHLGGFEVLSLPTRALLANPLPGSRVLVVENAQSGLALPALTDTVAVFGGGRNTAWTAASWLASRVVGYWGDCDSWGFKCLDDVRARQPHTRSLLMDRATVEQHRERMSDEPVPCTQAMPHLTAQEQALRHALVDARYGQTRLEQERLSSDWISAALARWHEAAA